MFSITAKQLENASVLTLAGRVDNLGAIAMEEELKAQVEQGHFELVLDMTEVRYMNSAGMRVLTEFRTTLRSNGGDLRLACLHPRVLHVFQIIGFDKFLSLYNTVDDALHNIK